MILTVPVPVQGLPAGSDRMVSTRIKGIATAIPCFDWCTNTHQTEDTPLIEDVDHIGESVAVALPRESGDLEQVFTAQLFAYPHAADGEGVKVSVDFAGDCFVLDAAGVDDFADQLITVASKLRGLGRVVGGAR